MKRTEKTQQRQEVSWLRLFSKEDELPATIFDKTIALDQPQEQRGGWDSAKRKNLNSETKKQRVRINSSTEINQYTECTALTI